MVQVRAAKDLLGECEEGGGEKRGRHEDLEGSGGSEESEGCFLQERDLQQFQAAEEASPVRQQQHIPTAIFCVKMVFA